MEGNQDTSSGLERGRRRKKMGTARAAAFGLLFVGLAIGYFAGRGLPAANDPPEKAPAVDEIGTAPEATDAILGAGKSLYDAQCSACHGAEGRGDGKAAFLLYPKPRNFANAQFRLVSTENGQPTDRDLFRTITSGMPGSSMPPWAHLAVDDRWALVHHVRRLVRDGKIADMVAKGASLEKAKEIAGRLLAPAKEVSIPERTEIAASSSIARGREIFLTSCAKCHDPDGRGVKKTDLKDEEGLPIRSRDFTAGVFKGGSDQDALAHRLLVGMPGTPMPSFKDTLQDPADLWAVVDLVRSMVPPGAQARVRQHQTTIEAARVTGKIDEDPAAAIWRTVAPTYIALMPLWWRTGRIEGVMVRALHDGTRLALSLSWEDATSETHALRPQDFPDAAAVQFSASESPPFFAMGAKDNPVRIWLWKACWQEDLAKYRDVEELHPGMAVDLYPALAAPRYGEHTNPGDFATTEHDPTYLTGRGAGNPMSKAGRATPVENLSARGFGTLEHSGPAYERVRGRAIRDEEAGLWRLVLVTELAASPGDVEFTAGKTYSAGFAVWDGGAGDRNGQKSVTIWHRIHLGE